MPARRFPPPWTIEDIGAAFVARDNRGQSLAYVYFEDEPERRSAAELLSKDKARRIATNFARLPKLLSNDEPASVLLERIRATTDLSRSSNPCATAYRAISNSGD
jgi:hypothetical protein